MPQANQVTVGNIPVVLSQGNKIPDEFPVLLVNNYNTWAGNIDITDGILDHMEHNFNQAIPHDKLPIDEEHVSGKAPGWIEKVMHKVGSAGNGLYVKVKWTKYGKSMLDDELYRYVSADFWLNYVDSEFGQEHGPTLTAVALTNRPMLESLPALFSKDGKAPDKNIQPTIINFSQKGESMDLEQILSKAPADVTEEEKTFLQEHQAELTDEQRTNFGLESGADDAGDGNDAGDGSDADGAGADADGDGADNGAGSDAPTDQGTQLNKRKTETVAIPRAELEALKFSANQGAAAKLELDQNRMDRMAEGFVFSQSNQDGMFLPKSQSKLSKFLFSLSDAQRKDFSALMAEAPKGGLVKLTQESGDGGQYVTSGNKLTDLAYAKMTSSAKDGTKINFSQALEVVSRENPDLVKAEYGL
jgi:hypothetical protein